PPRREAPARAAPAPQAPPSASLEERGFAPFNEVFTPSRNFGKAALGDVRMTPLARRLIAQNGLDAATLAARARIQGASRVAARDVQAALSEAPAAQRETYAPAITGPRTVEPMNRVRQMTARHLAGAWRTIPHVFQTIEIDFSAVSRTRGARKQAFRERHGAGLTFLPFIARAAAIAIAAYPRVNASVDGDKLLVAREINIGFAVDLAHEGLVVPVVKHADRLTVPGLAIAISELADKARKGKLAPGDLEGGTYSISNNGSFGTLFTAPLINAPQVAILSTDRIAKRPVAIETEYGDAIVARPVGVVAQSFDHRAIDGAYSAAFLQKLKSVIETHDWDLELS
ncbi:MAG: Dihydrolipoamide acetyltransferase component of pyruvate dehydrogenase complex, partial [Hyphomicrobiales bacterium]|nr:Dihydrolipoamide acetyltransferase component of pyruvate dehydrogenase complex [Hyphomicrobiales bacterium]